MCRLYLAFLFLVTSYYGVNAQSSFSKLYSYPIGSIARAETITGVWSDFKEDKLYFINYSLNISNNSEVSILEKADANGNIEDSLIINVPLGKQMSFWLVTEPLSNDSLSLYIPGQSKTASLNGASYELYKINKSLEMIWNRSFPTNTSDASLCQVYELGKQEMILLGCKWIENDIMPAKIHLVKIDSSGAILWEQTPGEGNFDIPTSMVPSLNGSFLIAGRTYSYGNADGSSFVMKVDSMGLEVWHKTYNLPYMDGFQKIIGTQDGNYVCVGFGTTPKPNSSDLKGFGYIVKINNNGDTSWTRKYDQKETSFWSVSEASNGDYVVLGTIYTLLTPDEAEKSFMVRIDKNGQEKWNKTLSNFAQPSNKPQYLYSIASLPDGGFVAGGFSYVSSSQPGLQDGWLAKVDSNGCFLAECGLAVKEPVSSIKTSIKLYPNPAVDFIHFESSSDLKIEKAILSDMYGNRIGIWPFPKHSISLPKVSSGIYLLQLETNNGIVIKKLSIL